MSNSVPQLVSTYQGLWVRFVEAYSLAEQAADAISAEEKKATRREYASVFRWDPASGREDLNHVATNLIEQLVNLAEGQLPPAGATLSIDSSEVKETWFVGEDRHQRALRDDFNPEAVWASLVEQYGGELAADEAYRQAAAFIVDFYDLDRLPEMKHSAGAVELDSRIYSERPWSGAPAGVRELHYNSRERLVKLVYALRTFLSWAGDEVDSGTHYGLQSFERTLSFDRKIHSRQKSGGGGIQFIFFFEKITTRFALNTAERLNEFVSTYSAAMKRALTEAAATEQQQAELPQAAGF